jgi:hypothetical protein
VAELTGLGEVRERARAEYAAAVVIRARKDMEGGCCSRRSLASCCEPLEKDECCGTVAATATEVPSRCGCAEGH